MTTARRSIAATIAATAALTAAACSTPHHVIAVAPAPVAAVSYAPAAYGVQAGSVFDCYYVDDVDEVTNLMAAGLCPPGSVATVMPLAWHETYALYYGSSAYYGTYIPLARRSTYTSVTVINFNKTYKTQIDAASKNATYKDSTGKTVPASQIPSAKMTFGSGVKPSANLGSGTNGGTTGGTTGSRTTTGGTTTGGTRLGNTTGGTTGGTTTTGGTRLGGGTTGGTTGSRTTTGGTSGGTRH